MIHVRAALFRIPLWVMGEQLDVELVQANRRLYIERVVFYRLERGDASERKKEVEVISEL